MSFYTVVNCMDGRVQLPVINYIMDRFGVDYVDSITEPGPNRLMAQDADSVVVRGILEKIGISLHRHKSRGVALVGHHDCAGNPSKKGEQVEQLRKAMAVVKKEFPDIDVIMLWVNNDWEVEEVAVEGA